MGARGLRISGVKKIGKSIDCISKLCYRINNEHLISKVRPAEEGTKRNDSRKILPLCQFAGTRVFCDRRRAEMDTRLANIAIIVEKAESVERLNGILHEYGDYIIGRMGIPHRERGVNLISIAVDAPQDTISSLSGKLGMLDGVTAKAVYSKV